MIQIRSAHPDDSPFLARIQVDSYQTEYAGILPEDYLAQFRYEEQESDWRELLATEQEDLLLVAQTEGGQIAGYALARMKDSTADGFDAELVALHLKQAYQRQGIGRLLLKVVAQTLQEKGSTSLMTWVLAENSARAFYVQLGAVLLDTEQTTVGGAREVAYGWSSIMDVAATS